MSWLTLSLSNKILVSEGKHPLSKIFQPISEKEMMELEHHHFAASSELVDLGIWLPQLLTSHWETQPNITCLLMKESYTA